MSDTNQDCQLNISQMREINIEIATTMAIKKVKDISQKIAQQLMQILAQIMLHLDSITKTHKRIAEAAISLIQKIYLPPPIIILT